MERRRRGGGARARARASTPPPAAPPAWQQRTPDTPNIRGRAVGRKEENDAAAATKENEQKEAEEARDVAPEVGTSPANAEPSARREQSRSR